jgi:adenosylhomocysteine nucleosidase
MLFVAPSTGSALKAMSEVAIVAALEREVAGLVRHWPRQVREFGGCNFNFFESGKAVLVCAGIGAEAARRASEAVVALYRPSELISAGYAGALDNTLRVGALLEASTVVDARDGSHLAAEGGSGRLVSFTSVAGLEQKAKLARAFSAQAVDMEAASVGKGALAHGLRFRAVKVVSDEPGFPMLPMDRFVTHDGRFRAGRFAFYVGVRPWTWLTVLRLARNTALASRVLCTRLDVMLRQSGIAPAGIPVGLQNTS